MKFLNDFHEKLLYLEKDFKHQIYKKKTYYNLYFRLSERTYSLWGYITKHMSEFLNPFYKKSYEHQEPVIMPNTSPQCVK